MSKLPHLSCTDDEDDRVGRRRSPRRYVEAQVQFGQNGQRARVRMIDLSRHGARLRCVHPVPIAGTFWITLPGLPPIAAAVTWVDGQIIGCEFAEPLEACTFDGLLPPASDPTTIDRRQP